MPKRDAEPAEVQKPIVAEKKAEPKKPETPVVDAGNVIFTDHDIRAMEYNDLDAIVAIYKIDFAATKGKSTKAKYSKLILAAQEKSMLETGATPKELAKYAPTALTTAVLSAQQLGTVSYSIGVTKNLGNYESMKLSATVELPIDPTPADIEKAAASLVICKDLVLDALNRDLAEIDVNALKSAASKP